MSEHFTGQLFHRGDPGFDEAVFRDVFNLRRPDRQPAAVLLVANVDDVVAGVRLAAANGWTVSIRSGGHSWAVWSVRDDALLLDLGALNSVSYDEATGIVIAGPAVKGGTELSPYLAEIGRAFPGGHCPEVGIGGYLLQGGQGWNGRLKGWACESVVALDVVTADGELLRADEHQNSDLLWAARGAGPGFPGIVVRFHLQTYPKPAAMWHDTWTFRLDDAEELLAWLHALVPTVDRRIEPVVAATRLPDVPLHPGVEHPGGTLLLLHTTVMADSDDEAQALLQPFAGGPLEGRELGHVQAPTSVIEECVPQGAQNPENHRYAVDCAWTNASADVLGPLLARLWGELDTTHSFSIWYGWFPQRELPDMAFSVEGDVYVSTYTIYTDPADDERYQTWVHERTAEIAAKGGVGVYLGDTDFTRRNDRFLSDANYERLEAIRAVRDPHRRIASYLTSDETELNVHA